MTSAKESSAESNLARWLCGVAVVALIGMLTIGLERFPIFFFCDEAYVGLKARELLTHGLHDIDERLMPLFYEKASGRWVPQLSIYLSLASEYFWPHSIVGLRLVTALWTIAGALFAAFTLKKLRIGGWYWWVPIAYVALVPVWVLHARLAFETSLVVAFYLFFIGSYCLYRAGYSKYLLLTTASGLAMFYAHFSGSTVFLVSAVLLAVFDLQFHRKHRGLVLGCIAVMGIGFLPFLLWFASRPDGLVQQLITLNSGWTAHQADSPVWREALVRYLDTFSPTHWLSEGSAQNIRHIWRGRSMIPAWALVISGMGILTSLIQWRDPIRRALLIMLFAGPTPVLLVDSHVMREFYLLAPLAFFAAVGMASIEALLRVGKHRTVLCGLFTGFIAFQAVVLGKEMLRDAPTWFDDYGLYGLQWGAPQLYEDVIPNLLAQYPSRFIRTPGEWANGVEHFADYFLSDIQRARIKEMELEKVLAPTIDPTVARSMIEPMIFGLSADEVHAIEDSKLFEPLHPIASLQYPTGAPGFIFTFLKPLPHYEDAANAAWRNRLSRESAKLRDSAGGFSVEYPQLDIGVIQSVFDHDDATLVRSASANPIVLNIQFDQPRMIGEVKGAFWAMRLRWKVTLHRENGTTAQTSTAEILTDDEYASVVSFPPQPSPVKSITMEIGDEDQPLDRAHVHIRELRFR